MNVNVESRGHAVVVNLTGELSEDSLGALKQAVDYQLGDREVVDVVLNMARVPFVDSAALEFLLDLQNRLGERLGRVRLLKCDQNVRKILEITRLDGAFEQFQDAAEAVKALHA
jgi:anti-anti-sigma factor